MNSTKFDVFLSHNSADKPAVEELARRLVKEGLQPWLDTWNLIPGEPWQVAIEEALEQCTSCAVFIGPSGIGPWHNEEMRAAISRRISGSQGRFRVIPVLLPGAEREERSRLPTFLVTTMWVEFRRTLGDEEAFHRLLSGIKGIAPGPGPGEAVYEGVCPYRGLQFFDVEHAPFFFGREALTEWLLNELRPGRQENRFLGIIGASGSGKSSLARAGLMAAIKQGKLPGSESWPVGICRPGADPLESLAIALADVTRMTPSDVLKLKNDFTDHEGMLHLTTRMALHEAPPARRLVLLVDQFEEVFTLCQDETLRRGLIDNLLYAATVPEGKTIVVLTMRADFYGKCADYPRLAAALSDHQVLVGKMTVEELRQAIECPAQLAGCEFEAGLTDLLLQEMKDQAGGLPLLQYALLELWEQREGRRLTLSAYRDIGGIEGALEQRAETIFTQFTETEKQLCRQVLLRLTHAGEDTEAIKRRVPMHELISTQGNLEQIEAVLQRLSGAEARLVTIEGKGDQEEERVVEVGHEALIRGWKRLRNWLNKDKEFLLWRQRLQVSRDQWEQKEHDEGVLLRGGLLAEAERWLKERSGELNDDEQRFIQESVTLRDDEEKQEKERQQRELEQAQALAAEKEQRAEAARKLAEEAQARQAAEEKARQEAEQRAEVQTKAATRLRRRALALAAVVFLAIGAAVFALIQQQKAQKNERLAKIQAEEANLEKRKAEKRRIEADEAKEEAEQQARKARIALSKQLAVQAQAELRNYPQRSLLLALKALQVTLEHKDYSPLTEKIFRQAFFNLHGWALSLDRPPIRQVIFNPEIPEYFVTISDDHSVRLWDSQADDMAASVLLLQKPGEQASIATFSPDGQWLAIGGLDGTVRLWKFNGILSESAPFILSEHKQEVIAMTFNLDSNQLFTGSKDGALYQWDLSSSPLTNKLVVPQLDEQVIAEITISKNTRWFVTRSSDGVARLWDLRESDPGTAMKVLNEQGKTITQVAISADNHWLVTRNHDGTARLWDFEAFNSSTISRLLSEDIGQMNTVIFSPDNRWIAAYGGESSRFVDWKFERTIWLWDLSKQPSPPVILNYPEAEIVEIAISQDSKWLISRGIDNATRVWDLENLKKALDDPDPPPIEPLVLSTPEEDITAMAISPDSKWLILGSRHGNVRLWDLKAEKPTSHILPGHEQGETITEIIVSPDVNLLLTRSTESSARLWDLVVDPISENQSSRPLPSSVFPLETLISMACGKAGRNLTEHEWQSYFPGEQYDPPCTNSDFSLPVRDYITVFQDARTSDFDSQAQTVKEKVLHLMKEGSALAQEGKIRQCIATYIEVQKLDPTLVTHPQQHAYKQVARALLEKGQGLLNQTGNISEEVIDLYTEVQKFDPYIDSKTKIRQDAADAARIWLFKGDQLFQERNLHETLDAYSRALNLHSENTDIYKNRGIAYKKLQQYDLAIADFTKAIEFEPDDPDLYTFRGLTYNVLQQYDLAIADFTKTIGLIPNDGDAYKNRAVVHRVLQRNAQAMADFTKAAGLEPYNYEILNSFCWNACMWGGAATVLDTCERAVELTSCDENSDENCRDDGSIRDSRGIVRALNGDFTGAIADFQEFVDWTENERQKSQRQEWITALQSGKNPFTPKELQRFWLDGAIPAQSNEPKPDPLSLWHRYGNGSIYWRITPDGVEIQGAGLVKNLTYTQRVAAIWRSYKEPILAASQKYGIPVPVIIATISTESGGNPNAYRYEPIFYKRYIENKDPWKENLYYNEPTRISASYGLMQFMYTTAYRRVGFRGAPEDLYDPATNIDVGTAFIARGFHGKQHQWDPPKIACAYNAGSVRTTTKNAWGMSYHPGYLDRWIPAYNGAIEVLGRAEPGGPSLPVETTPSDSVGVVTLQFFFPKREGDRWKPVVVDMFKHEKQGLGDPISFTINSASSQEDRGYSYILQNIAKGRYDFVFTDGTSGAVLDDMSDVVVEKDPTVIDLKSKEAE